MIAHISEDLSPRTESVAEHTAKAAFLCERQGRRCGLAKVMSLCGILHDMGKNKEKFDNYIRAGQKDRQSLRGKIAHASTGAKYLYDRYHGGTGNQKLLAEMAAYTVAAHHGLFDCVNVEHTDLFSQKLSQVEDYEEACRNAEADYLKDYPPLEEAFQEALGEFEAICCEIKGSLGRFQGMLGSRDRQEARKAQLEWYFFQLSCFQRLMLSILIDADWEATSDFMGNTNTLGKQPAYCFQEVFQKAAAHFESFMKQKQEEVPADTLSGKEREIFEARNALQQECRSFAGHPAGIYCLPLPTGGGKTLSGLAYALEFCRLHPETERIIYVSPYISITEQNAEVFRQATGCGEWILEHHSSVVREQEESEDYRARRTSRFDVNWEEPFICTTFVQFMNTLFSDKSESIRRMHRLAHAVVIIDEVQSMPLSCVHTFNYMVNFLNTVCHTDIILCTATQPVLGEAQCPLCYSEHKYMVQDVEKWFHTFERVKIRVPQIGEKYTIESLGEEIAGQTEQYRSILVVLNTKSAVKELYDLLKLRGINAAYLTTNLCAQHRSDRLRSIKNTLREGRESIVVVSTNLIEAGVDISFAYVYRSMAGLDSLAQSAGRCNRNGELKEGTVSLIQLEGEHTGSMKELLANRRAAEHVLDEYQRRGSSDSLLLPEWMDQYYRNVYQGASEAMNFPLKDLGTNLVKLLSWGFHLEKKANTMNQAYKTAGHAYRVIDEDSFGVIVPYKEGAQIIEALQSTSDPLEVKRLIQRAQRYTVNVRSSQQRKLEGLMEPVSQYFPDIYMIGAPGAYQEDWGITAEWEPLIL